MSRSDQQRGSALIIVIFVIVIVGFLATSLTRTSWSTHDANTRSVMGTQAWLAESFSKRVRDDSVLSKTLILRLLLLYATLCSRKNDSTNISNFSESLVESATVSCELHRLECENRGQLNDMSFYVLESSVICGTEDNRVQRNQQVWVREQEQL